MYIARLNCGCIVEAHDNDRDESLLYWLYCVLGNGWIVEEIPDDAQIVYDCPACEEVQPLRTQRMF